MDVDIEDNREVAELFESVDAVVCAVERRPYCSRSEANDVGGTFDLAISCFSVEILEPSVSEKESFVGDTGWSAKPPGVREESAFDSASANDSSP